MPCCLTARAYLPTAWTHTLSLPRFCCPPSDGDGMHREPVAKVKACESHTIPETAAPHLGHKARKQSQGHILNKPKQWKSSRTCQRVGLDCSLGEFKTANEQPLSLIQLFDLTSAKCLSCSYPELGYLLLLNRLLHQDKIYTYKNRLLTQQGQH